LPKHSFDAYISLRIWCVAGVLADEAIIEAERILKSQGRLIISFPLRYKGKLRSWDNVLEDKIAPVARWTRDILQEKLFHVNCHAGYEDFFMYGRLKWINYINVLINVKT